MNALHVEKEYEKPVMRRLALLLLLLGMLYRGNWVCVS